MQKFEQVALSRVPVMTTVARYQPPIAPLPDAIVFTSIDRVRNFVRHDLFHRCRCSPRPA